MTQRITKTQLKEMIQETINEQLVRNSDEYQTLLMQLRQKQKEEQIALMSVRALHNVKGPTPSNRNAVQNKIINLRKEISEIQRQLKGATTQTVKAEQTSYSSNKSIFDIFYDRFPNKQSMMSQENIIKALADAYEAGKTER